MSIACFTGVSDDGPLSDLKKKFDALSEGKSEEEQRAIAKGLVTEFHKSLHDDLSKVSKNSGVKIEKIPRPSEITKQSKNINKEHDQLVRAATMDDSQTTGPSRRVRQKMADATGTEITKPGIRQSIKANIQRGHDLIDYHGVKPEEVLAEFKKDGRLSTDDVNVLRAQHDRLATTRYEAGKKYGVDSKEFKTALAAEKSWEKDAICQQRGGRFREPLYVL